MQNEITLLHNYLIVGAMLFGTGMIGFLSRRNMIVMFLAAEMMLQGVSLSLVAWSRFHGNFHGQTLVIFIIAVAACEAAIALALIVMLFRSRGNLDITAWQDLRESNEPPFEEAPLPELPTEQEAWPTLPPTGVLPETDTEKTDYRPNV